MAFTGGIRRTKEQIVEDNSSFLESIKNENGLAMYDNSGLQNDLMSFDGTKKAEAIKKVSQSLNEQVIFPAENEQSHVRHALVNRDISGLIGKFREVSEQKNLVDELKEKRILVTKRKSKLYDVLKSNLEGFSEDELEALTENLYNELKEELK